MHILHLTNERMAMIIRSVQKMSEEAKKKELQQHYRITFNELVQVMPNWKEELNRFYNQFE